MDLKERAEQAAKWLQSLMLGHPQAAIDAIYDRSMPDADGDKHGLLGLINASLGWGQWRVQLVADDEVVRSVAVVEYNAHGNPVVKEIDR